MTSQTEMLSSELRLRAAMVKENEELERIAEEFKNIDTAFCVTRHLFSNSCFTSDAIFEQLFSYLITIFIFCSCICASSSNTKLN